MNNKKEITLLDSNLNSATLIDLPLLNSYKNYNIKIIDCKDYKQVYIFERQKSYKYKNLENNLKSYNDYNDSGSIYKEHKENKILFRNIMRSKLKLQRLAKCNSEDWKTFITLTFEEHITDLNYAYNKFRNFITVLSRHKEDFKWLCVPEFQKSGRVHYHLVTNIAIDEPNLIEEQEYKGKIYYHLKYWNHGFDCVESVKDKDGNDTKKLCGYISKYMSKSYIEDCFFNKNRYYCSKNLEFPVDILLDTNNESDREMLESVLSNCENIYSNDYLDEYTNSKVTFIEFKVIKNV